MVRRTASGRLACGRGLLVLGVWTSLLWVGMNANVAGEFIASAETLFATGMCADVGFLAGMGANVSGLVFETVKGTGTERALVRTRDLRLVDGVVASCKGSRIGGGIGHVGGGRLRHCRKENKGGRLEIAGALKDGRVGGTG